jgi:single-strand DNA-binding protein
MHVTHIIGRVGSDPKPLGQSGCAFSIATEEYNGATKQRETTWSRCVAFGKTAEIATKYVTKGRMIAVLATYQVREYTGSAGEKREDHSFRIRELELLPDGKNHQQQQAGDPGNPLW